MYRYKSVLAALNLTELDVATAGWTGMITQLAKSERVYFAHVAEKLAIPDALRAQYSELTEPTEDVIESRLRHAALEHFKGHPDARVRYIVADGAPIIELIHRIHQHDVDLVVVGKAAEKEHGGNLPERVARKAPCSVLVVHEGADPRVDRILVPLDFSDQSAAAFEVAVEFARAANASTIHCVHAYGPWPRMHYDVETTREAVSDLVREHAEEEYEGFLSRFDLVGLNVKTEVFADPRPARAIKSAIAAVKPDLVVMGARGRTDAAALVLGSVTEHMIRSTEVSLLAVKQKGEGMGVLKALLNL